MSNKVKDIRIKNHIYYFFDDIINIKNFDSNNIEIDEKPYKVNGHFEEINKNKYLTLVPTNESK